MDTPGSAPLRIVVLIASDFALAPEREARWLRDLPAVRQADIARWPDGAARHRSLLGTRLLREGLRRFGFHDASLSSLRHAPTGRPTLDLPLDFSLSHCEGRVLCALSCSGPIGVDVEPIGSLVAADFPNYLSAAERAWAGGDPRRFYSIWTRKEAVVKAAGQRGLAELRHVDTQGADGGATFAGVAWQTASIPMGIAHVAHLACGPGRQSLACVTVEHLSREQVECN
ncbi:4'-phosphopantetheinyl transferase family protein [Ramlibacter alkalitolerans]|uniref:4'-phosphopantetheinyl transferase superfamily protein n=1 Tax=Ramlibacter alkalitolerans TaxID=2039631 RepID=A0ABS1JWM6_9BURK|nr:4'-phosphopantetheinyl transferase superfamily protein [Ramlibacter alkalitolerans]MBL0428501.1 4'-phosphopantetheinyl transferase superfamily protein [Ramlibacter alkalitolerans]